MKKLLLFLLLFTTFILADTLQQGSVIIRSISVASAGATTSLTSTSKNYTVVTGVLTENIELPDATTLIEDRKFTVANRSTGAVTVKDDGGTTLKVLAPGEDGNFKILDISTSDGNWLIIKTGDFLADGSVPLTGPLDVGINPIINASTIGLDNGSDRAYIFKSIYGVSTSLQSLTGSSFFGVQSAPDDGSVAVGLGLSAQTGDFGGPVEALNIFYNAGAALYRFQSFCANGGTCFPINWDTSGSDNVPELVMQTDGNFSFENNSILNVATLELDNGTDKAYTLKSIYGITTSLQSSTGSSFFNIQSAPDDASVAVGFSLSARTGNLGGEVEALNLFYRTAGGGVYQLGSFCQNGGTCFPIQFDTAGNDNVPEIIFKTNGDTSFEGNRVINVGEFATSEQLVALTADDQSVTATRSMMRVTSNNVTSTNRTMDLQDGTNNGQRLTIISDTPTNAWELINTGNQCLTANFTSTDNAALNLIWNSTTACWHEPR